LGPWNSPINRSDELKVAWSEIQEAQRLLGEHFEPTRLVLARSLGKNGAPVYLKLETDLPTGSFKVRGALFALHSELKKRRVKEVVAASTGNHGAAVAHAARLLHVAASIFLPSRPNPVKRRRIEELGARIIEKGKDITDATTNARVYAAQTDSFLLDDSTDPRVPIGTATIACEIVDQLPDVGAIWVPIGDTALIRGIASAAKHLVPGLQIIGVQADRAPAYYLSWKQGHTINTDTCDTIADGLATRNPVDENVATIRQLVDEMRLVTDKQMLGAILHLQGEERVVAEPAGAATTAAWMADSNGIRKEATVLVVSGANLSPDLISQQS
jgi:threonine dehydratase